MTTQVESDEADEKCKPDASVDFNSNIVVDSDCLRPAELSKLQHLIDLKKQNKDANFNLTTLEFDIQKAIEYSLAQDPKIRPKSSQLTHFGENNSDLDDQLPIKSLSKTQFARPTTSKRHIDYSNEDGGRNSTIELPYDSLFLNANENDISTIIKNMKNVLYDDSRVQDKTAKVCNFPLKNK